MLRREQDLKDAKRSTRMQTLLDDSGLFALAEYMKELPLQPPSFPAVIGTGLGGHMKQYEVEGGTSFSWSLLDLPSVSVAKWFASTGASFPEHAHDQIEWIIVYQGSLVFVAGEKETLLTPGKFIHIAENVPHTKKFTEDCFFLAITVPRCTDWPGAITPV